MGLIDYCIDRIGPAVLASSIVACLVQGELGAVHITLMGAGLALVVLGWWRVGRCSRG